MNNLLASVTGPGEALLALECGADVIDCKDPWRGPLGGLSPSLIEQVVTFVRGRRPVSATVGDLPTDAEHLAPAVRAVASVGVDYVKIGFSSTEKVPGAISSLSPLARRHRLIAVLFADRAPDLGIIPELAAADFTGVMLDTLDKDAGDLLEHRSPQQLAEFVSVARRHRLLCGLAGSLGSNQIPELLPLAADYLGFRGALCSRERTSGLNRTRFANVRRALSAPHPTPH